MTMSFLLHESPAEFEASESFDRAASDIGKYKVAAGTQVSVTEEKFRIPAAGNGLRRTRLLDLLAKSIDQYGATLVSGRAGSGKTTLAADFLRSRRACSWYSIGPSDSDWSEFARCFATSLFDGRSDEIAVSTKLDPERSEVSQFIGDCYARLRREGNEEPRVSVLDNVHHLFDAPWFSAFFTEFIVALDSNIRLLILCRSKPNATLWRMRSKQMLNVLDEHLLDFTDREARVLSLLRGIPEQVGSEARRRSFGRAARLVQHLDDFLP